MSFVDLATLTLHRRHELESRTLLFDEKCDRAINDIKRLKLKAKGFVSELNCDPSELKDRFLNVMQKLDEYIYLITDFNLAMAQTADTSSVENTPVQDTPNLPPSLSPFNLMDVLSEPGVCQAPSIPYPAASHTLKDQGLIVFSSSSSAESMPGKSDQETQCCIAEVDIVEPVQPVAASSPALEQSFKECCITAAQTILEVDHEYPATIMCTSSHSFWVITEDALKVTKFMTDMTDYYTNNRKKISASDLEDMTYCAYRDEDFYYRAMILQKPEGELKTVNVYVIDTGEERVTSIESIQPLFKQFCDMPPYARLCHLAGLDFQENLNDKALIQQQDEFMKKYTGTQCTIMIEDNSSESLGVYVILPGLNTTLNQIMLDHDLAVLIDNPLEDFKECPKNSELQRSNINHGPPPENSIDEGEWNITDCPEYEDPVVAVTGYHNRDEADICKHYKGGPAKTCFKGARCNKKHILHHPGVATDQLSESGKSIEINACSYHSINKEITDGWTLDREEVNVKCAPMHLPRPGTWLKVLVTTVCHYDRVFVQIIQNTEEEEVPEFGVVLPPMTLTSLQRDMNSLATKQALKYFTVAPAVGEIVTAIYPFDNRWYRAKILTIVHKEQIVEVMFIDYGTVLWVKENLIRKLEPRFTLLPAQAVQCVLAGVRSVRSAQSVQWARAKQALAQLTQDKQLEAHVIGREYDEIIIELFTYDAELGTRSGQSVAEQLAQRGLVELDDYEVIDDQATQKKVAAL